MEEQCQRPLQQYTQHPLPNTDDMPPSETQHEATENYLSQPLPQSSPTLLIVTLRNIWENYLQSCRGNDADIKQHWLALFLYHFQFIDDRCLEQDDHKSFFNLIPEEICSYLLEQVYEIISKSDLYSPAQLSVQDDDGPDDGDDCDDDDQDESGKRHRHLTKLLRRKHNFAQLILSAPSDCSKIVALRSFLTHQLGQHLLQFLLKVDIKLIASQKSLCQLCINLFPNCPWGESTTELPQPRSVFDFVGNLNFYQKVKTKQRQSTRLRSLFSRSRSNHGESVSPSSPSSASLSASPLPSPSPVPVMSFELFQRSCCSHDEIASILIRLLSKCIGQESETTLGDQSMSILALNFALDNLRLANGSTFGRPSNALAIKWQFVHLIEMCLNNLFANDENVTAIQFQNVFAKLSAALESNRCVTGPDSSREFLYALLFITFGILHNVVAVYGAFGSSVGGGGGKHNLYTVKFMDDNVMMMCVETLKELLQEQRATKEEKDKAVETEAEAETDTETVTQAETRLLSASICKTLIRIIDNLCVYDEHSFSSGGGGSGGGGSGGGGGVSLNGVSHQLPPLMLLQQQQQLQRVLRRKKSNKRQMHCSRLPSRPLSCYFQGILLDLLPEFDIDLQAYAVRYLLRSGTCCCHYTLATYETCLRLAGRLSTSYQRCAYKFLYRKILNAIFVRHPETRSKRHHQAACGKCDAKLKSLEFHGGLMRLYREMFDRLTAAGGDVDPLNVFLKHLKHIAHLLTHDIASGLVAELALPIFRGHKAKLMEYRRQGETEVKSTSDGRGKFSRSISANGPTRKMSSAAATTAAINPQIISKSLPSSPLPDSSNSRRFSITSMADHLKTLHECLNVFVIYLSDIRLIKAFYNEENIKHLEDLLAEPELIRGICDLIKIGIDNLTFLGDNNHEQTALSRRLITLQLNSSDRAAQLFGDLLNRLGMRNSRSMRSMREKFWLDEETAQSGIVVALSGSAMKPLDVLHIAALQWSLNYELLRTSQYFYNEFAKIYSIVVEEDDDNDTEADGTADEERRDYPRNYLKHGDKTIIDILRLNYNALSAFLLMMPPDKGRPPSTPPAPADQGDQKEEEERQQRRRHRRPHVFDCHLSASLESLLASMEIVEVSSGGVKAAIASSDELEFSYERVTRLYEEETGNEMVIQHLQQLEQPKEIPIANDNEKDEFAVALNDESVVLFDIRHQRQSLPPVRTTPSRSPSPAAMARPTSLGAHSLLSAVEARGSQAQSVISRPTSAAAHHHHQRDHDHNHRLHMIRSQSHESIIGKLFSMFGSLFGGSQESSINDLSSNQQQQQQKPQQDDDHSLTLDDIDTDLHCLYEANGDCKKLLLKLFEATMAICIKGYQNEEVEKMQKHLRKLKAVILSNAHAHWDQHAEEHARENTIVQTLQTLLRIAEFSSSLNEPAAVVSSVGGIGGGGGGGSILTTATDDVTMSLPMTSLRPRGRSFTSGSRPKTQPHTQPASAQQHHRRPASGDSGDVDFFSTRASIICPDSELEFSENDDDPSPSNDYYLTADEGYEADGEVLEVSDSDGADLDAGDLWNSFQPASRYRSHVLHDGLSRLVVEILVELSEQCTRHPEGWSDSLAQLANRLFVIRECLGGPLFLMQGFAPVLQSNDVRLKDLQQSILELIVDLNTPDVLAAFFSILASPQPPVDILMKYMNYICSSSLRKAQPSIELEFPVAIDGKCISTSNPTISEHIDRVRNYHLHCQVATPFTRAPCIIPLTHARLWNSDGFTLSLWLQVKASGSHKSSSQLTDDDTRSSSDETGGAKTHIASVGTNQAMLSIYLNGNMNLVFETCKPNAEIQTRPPPPPTTPISAAVSPTAWPSPGMTTDETTIGSFDGGRAGSPPAPGSKMSTTKPQWIANASAAAAAAAAAADQRPSETATSPGSGATVGSPFRNALKQTKLVLLNSFSHMHLFNGHSGLGGGGFGSGGDAYFVGSLVDLKFCRLPKNKWTHLAFAVDTQPDRLDVIVFIDGLEQHVISLPFRSFRNLTRTHIFQMIALGDSCPPAKTPNATGSYTESRSTLDGCPLRYGISNVMLFNRKITQREPILNLTAMGPDFGELAHFQVGGPKPNYGLLNLSKTFSAHFGHFAESMQFLKSCRILAYSAQQPDIVMGFNPRLEMENITYGQPVGLILYGELVQNQLQSLQTATLLSGGLSSLLFLFARVVELNAQSATQAMALDLLLSVALSESQLYGEFLRNDYTSLIGYVIKAERCSKDVPLLKSIVNNACSQPLICKRAETLHVNETTTAMVIYPRLITSILHRYSDWHRSGAEHSDVLDTLFQCLLALTREKHPHRDFNVEQLQRAGVVHELLNLCKVYVIESPNPVFISRQAADSFVGILAAFAGSPPSPSLIDEMMKLLLLLHKPSECYITHDRGKFYFLLTAQLPPAKEKSALTTANLSSRVAAPFRRTLSLSKDRERPGTAVPVAATTQTTPSLPTAAATPDVIFDAQRLARINRLRKLHARSSQYKRALGDLEENLENVADCSRLNKNALRLLNPVEATRWRTKFKHRVPPSSPCPDPGDRLGLSPQQRITHKRQRSLSAAPPASPGSSRRSNRLSESSMASAGGNSSDSHPKGADIGSGDSIAESCGSRRHPSRPPLIKTDFYSSAGIVALQEGLLMLIKDFLCLLPDSVVEDVLRHYVKVEFLLVFANHSSCSVRAAIIKLLATLSKRLPPNEIHTCQKNFYAQHLGNQLSIHPCDGPMFEASVGWVTGVYGDMESLLRSDELRVRNRFGLNAMLAMMTNAPADCIERAFRILRRMFETDPDEQQTLIDAGLLQVSVRALYNLHAKASGPNACPGERAIVDLLTVIGERSLKSVGHINVLWDILNMLTFYQEKQPAYVVKAFRSVQGKIQYNWIVMFFGPSTVAPTSKPGNFKVRLLPNSSLSLSETRTRFDLLIDRCSQFFTVFFDTHYTPSQNEIDLFELLVTYGISTNQRCNNFIAWGLQPSRPRDLRAFIVDALWRSCQDDFVPSIICDGKMIKSLLWLSLLEDLEPPIESLQRLCRRLGISENDSTWNLENELERIELNRCTVTAKQKSLLEKTVYKFETLAVNCIETSMVTTRRVTELQNAERKLLMGHMKDYDETGQYAKWLEIIRRMTHEGAPWYCRDRFPTSWELDDTEGPSRVHTRLRRCHLDIDRRFFMDEVTADRTGGSSTPADYTRPLDYLISGGYDQQLNISLDSQILYNFPAKYLPVDGEIDGEIIVTDHKLYFLATYRCKYFYVSCDISNITEIWLKRYQHQEKAFEIFLDTNKSLFFSLQNQDDWKIMSDVFCDKIVTPPDQSKVLLITQQWREGLLTNWEYMMTLNQIAGRTYNDLMQYPVFPWILSNYLGDTIDLTVTTNFRKLEKPIAVQHPKNEEHYISNYTYLNDTPTNMGSMVLRPYHYSSLYSNSGTVLHFLVRVPPFTTYFLRYQDNNFDMPDRTFHALNTTWSLASRDSPTDVKELIPEFFCLPEMFENFERLNFGCRQNGERVEDVLLPGWCHQDARLFVLVHRQALESEAVRNNLHHWIDLIFGYKQTGESAVEAINVFHQATYSFFLESEISDPYERKAAEAMVKTYGQMPRQLFKSPHPATKPLNYCLGEKAVLESVRGLRWGVYAGSPQLPPPSLGNIHQLTDAEHLVSFNNTNVVYGLPAQSCIMQGADTDTFNMITWSYNDRIVRIQPLNKPYARPKNLLYNSAFDDITACGSDPNSNQLWFGHRSGRISVYRCSSGEASSRSSKSRQTYVRGLRLSYNSAFRKMTSGSSKSSAASGHADDDMVIGGVGSGGLGSGGLGGDGSSLLGQGSASGTGGGIGGGGGLGGGVGGGGGGGGVSGSGGLSSSASASDGSSHRDGSDLVWSGPTVLMRHTDAITCISLSVEFKIAVSTGRDGLAVIWDLNDLSYVRTIERPAEIHQSPVTLVAISPTLGDIVTVHSITAHGAGGGGAGGSGTGNAGDVLTGVAATASGNSSNQEDRTSTPATADECFEVTEENLDDFVNVTINPNGKSILRLHSVNARYIQHIVHDERILAVCYSYIKEGVGVNVIATAVEGGVVRLWSSWNLNFITEIITGISNIKSITYSTHQHLVVLTKESRVQVWETDGLYGNSPKFPQIQYK